MLAHKNCLSIQESYLQRWCLGQYFKFKCIERFFHKGSDTMKWTSRETLDYVYPLLEHVLKSSVKSFHFH